MINNACVVCGINVYKCDCTQLARERVEGLEAKVRDQREETDKFASLFNYPSADIVCVCGCHDIDHEPCDEEGYGCGVDDHECIWAPRSVMAIVGRLRAKVKEQREALANLDCYSYTGNCNDCPTCLARKEMGDGA